MIFWGIGSHLGRGLSQSVMGDRLGHVKDFSREDPLARAYRNKQELSPHTDSADFVGLACLRQAQSGGVSRLTSAVSVHNTMLAENPETLNALSRLYLAPARRGEAGGSAGDALSGAGFLQYRGKVSPLCAQLCRGGELLRVGPPSAADLASPRLLEAMTKRPELMLEFKLEPGEIYFINNYTILHARTAFDDGEAEEDQRRHS